MQNDITASFISMWDKDGLTVQVTVEDAVKDDNDAVAVYVDSANSGKDDITPVTVTVKKKRGSRSRKWLSGNHKGTVIRTFRCKSDRNGCCGHKWG